MFEILHLMMLLTVTSQSVRFKVTAQVQGKVPVRIKQA